LPIWYQIAVLGLRYQVGRSRTSVPNRWYQCKPPFADFWYQWYWYRIGTTGTFL